MTDRREAVYRFYGCSLRDLERILSLMGYAELAYKARRVHRAEGYVGLVLWVEGVQQMLDEEGM